MVTSNNCFCSERLNLISFLFLSLLKLSRSLNQFRALFESERMFLYLLSVSSTTQSFMCLPSPNQDPK